MKDRLARAGAIVDDDAECIPPPLILGDLCRHQEEMA